MQNKILLTVLKYSPRLVIKVLTVGCENKSIMLEIVVSVYEESAERYWAFFEALSEYSNAIGEVEASLTSLYQNLAEHDAKFTHDVLMLSIADRKNGELTHQKEVEIMEATMEEIRDNIRNRIDSTLTFWFRVLHPDVTRRLEYVIDELDNMEFDYVKYYLEGVLKYYF